MRALLLSLACAASAHAAAVHPLLALVRSSPGLKLGVALELKTLGLAPDPLATQASLTARQVALGLVAFRDELPAGAVAEVLGHEAEQTVRTFTLASDAAAKLRAELASTEELAAELDVLFDNRAAGEGGALVQGKESPSPFVLKPVAKGPGAFKREKFVLLPEGRGLPAAAIEKGSVDGRPAWRLRFGDGTTLVVVLAGKARTWAEARALAQGLGAGGVWDLPTEDEFMTLAMSAALDIRVPLEDDEAVYPMWARADDERRDAFLRRSSLLLTMRDGRGMDVGSLEAGPAGVVRWRAALQEAERLLDKKKHRSESEERAIRAALDELSAKTGAVYNPNVPHDELSWRINRMLRKPSRKSLEARRDALKSLVAALAGGYPVYAVSSPELPPQSESEAN